MPSLALTQPQIDELEKWFDRLMSRASAFEQSLFSGEELIALCQLVEQDILQPEELELGRVYLGKDLVEALVPKARARVQSIAKAGNVVYADFHRRTFDKLKT